VKAIDIVGCTTSATLLSLLLWHPIEANYIILGVSMGASQRQQSFLRPSLCILLLCLACLFTSIGVILLGVRDSISRCSMDKPRIRKMSRVICIDCVQNLPLKNLQKNVNTIKNQQHNNKTWSRCHYLGLPATFFNPFIVFPTPATHSQSQQHFYGFCIV
jgi:hypothetical protein